ncbi:hypothetical protein NM688_g7641 [Phlebia brevispora]|uniref:Uncharacterized protein n=1 Tax=Phlebia brevispora TaxID=194682 RepID=A0ACC1S2W8_9APHY|nr:hypothetical protein NM688_g7641 [Phlebia brevispora]
MPTCRRKRVLLAEPSPAILDAAKSDPNKQVFQVRQTGEIFDSYEYEWPPLPAAHPAHNSLPPPPTEPTPRACPSIDSNNSNAKSLARAAWTISRPLRVNSRKPGPCTPGSQNPSSLPYSKQFSGGTEVVGRLDHLVEAVFDRFKDRYYPDERVFVDVQGDKYLARVVQVFPPRPPPPPQANGVASSSSSPTPLSDEGTLPIHKVAEDLKVSVQDSVSRDDPTKYTYKVQILEEEKPHGSSKGGDRSKGKEVNKSKYTGSLMDVKCTAMSRDRLAFSKSILRRFIRDCVDRDAAVASPWIVKDSIAIRYGVDTVMPEETRKGVEDLKKGESEKRKKLWEEKEGPPTKKQKKLAAAEEEKAKALAAAAERREREAREKEEKAQKAKEESERLAAEKKKKKPIRYPTEDLDVVIGEKEKKAGMKVKRPAPSRAAMPFGRDNATNEAFLMAWNFLVVYGQPLHISSFNMDEFEQALRHTMIDPPCNLIAEIHSTLIYNLRTVPFTRHSAVLSLLDLRTELGGDHRVLGVTLDELTSAAADIGNNWERAPLRHAEGREGWEESLVGCLKDHANIHNFPHLREILTRLLFAPEPAVEVNSMPSTPAGTPPPQHLGFTVASTPRERYHSLTPKEKIDILFFFCNLAISSKAIHAHMESCEEQLTELRKQKIEVNRTKKAYLEEMNTLMGENKEPEKNGEKKLNGTATGEGTPMAESSDLSEVPASDGETETGSAPPRQSARRAQAKERELARAKLASHKQAMAEHRRLDEEVNKCERRLEQIERDFRKLLGSIRVKPLGRDRFYNRVWWFDGMGAMSLLGSGGSVQYGTGRIFIQGPSEFDVEILRRREEDVAARRLEEEGEDGMLDVGEWAVYDDLETVDQFVAWLNPKGVREVALKNTIAKWWQHIAPGIRRRTSDLAASAKLPEARRSTRTKHPGSDIIREPYMMWTNRRAVNSS